MKIEDQEAERFFKTFVNTLGRYRIGQSLMREVSLSSSKDRRSYYSFRSVSFNKTKRVASYVKNDQK